MAYPDLLSFVFCSACHQKGVSTFEVALEVTTNFLAQRALQKPACPPEEHCLGWGPAPSPLLLASDPGPLSKEVVKDACSFLIATTSCSSIRRIPGGCTFVKQTVLPLVEPSYFLPVIVLFVSCQDSVIQTARYPPLMSLSSDPHSRTKHPGLARAISHRTLGVIVMNGPAEHSLVRPKRSQSSGRFPLGGH